MLAQWEGQKQIYTSFIGSLPKELNDEVAGKGRSLFMPLLKNVLGGVGGVHWLGIGFLFIAWSLDNISSMIQNREDCIENLRRSLRLLKKTKEIWEATNIDGDTRNGVLQDSVEKAVRCAIFCTSTLTDAWILRCLKASSVKDAIAMIRADLDAGDLQNIELMGRHNLLSKFERQITFVSSDDDIVGGQEVIPEAVTYLKTSSDDIMAICLHGMGGIGKSSLGLKIFAEFQKSKYRDCRVELQLETKQEDLCDIQKQIVEKVCKHATSKFSNLTDGKRIMEKELEKIINDPIFLYVDNVLDHRFVTDLLPKASFFPKGSRILITSRGDYIRCGIADLGITNYRLIEVRKLQKLQAQQLLWKQLKSKGEHMAISGVESLEERVLELCDGLPLALTVVGKYIADDDNGLKKVEVWRQVVDDMQNAEPLRGEENDDLYSRIMFSMHNLDPNVKSAFLDIIVLAYCGDWKYDRSWEKIERLMVRKKYLTVLCKRALVLGNREKSSPEIHDVIKAKGKRMIKEDEKELRIIGMEEFEKHKNALERVVALVDVALDAYLLKEMPMLRLLHEVTVLGECQEIIQLRHLRVVRRLSCSTTRVFDWSVCADLKEVAWGDPIYAEDMAPNVSNLEVFKHEKISMGLEALALSHWSQLKDVNVIETFTCLKELQFDNCHEIESLPEGISRLTGLNKLVLRGCGKLEGLPQGISRLICLEVLDLQFCSSVQSLPDGLTSLTGLAKLDLRFCWSLQNIPEGIGNLRGVTDFNIEGCESLESIPEGATNLMNSSTRLSLTRCTRITYLPEGVTRLTGLKELDLRWCGSLRSLPEAVSDLTGLTSLSLFRCKRLQALPEGIASLSGLIELDLECCSALQSLPKQLSRLTGLTKFSLSGCRSLQALPEKLGFMTGLRELNLQGYKSLQFLPDEISKLTGLVFLDLSDCKSLQSIEGVTTLTALTILDVRDCTELQLLPEGCTRLTSLRHIYLSGCRSLKSIPEASLTHLTGLNRPLANSIPEEERKVPLRNFLNLINCKSLMSLPQSIGSFTHLERLDLGNCTSLESLPEGVTRLSNLAELSLLGCRSLQCLPRGLIRSLTGLTELKLGKCAMLIQPLLEEVSCNMTSLKELELSECEDLQSLPQGMTNLMCLEKVSLSGCRNLHLLPQGMANWTGLTRLDLSGCQSLQSLPEELTTLTALSDLNLSGCACLRSLPQGIFTSLAGLESLSMSECGGLQLEESQGITMLTGLTSLDLSESEHLLFPLSEQGLAASLTGLERLNLSGCRSLQYLPEGVAALTNLEILQLSGCRSLQYLPEGVAALTNLMMLELSGCASLQSLSNLPQGSRRLWYLDLGGCGSLDQPSVWETILSFKSLTHLYLSGWDTMQALPESVTKMTRLYALSLAECKNLQSLRPEITRLVGLNELDLSGCTSLEPLPEDITMWISGIDDYRPCQHESLPQSD